MKAELRLSISEAISDRQQKFEFPARASCPSCGGTGAVQQHVCPSCAGVGYVHKNRKVELKIPENVRDGLKLRLKNLGEPGEVGGESGDLYLLLRLTDDDTYRLLGDDLEVRISIAPWEAQSGAKVDVRTPRGVVVVTVPPKSRSGNRLRLRDQGFAKPGGGQGDCFVRIEMNLPDSLTRRQEELLREIGEAAAVASPGPEREGDSS